MKKYTVYLNDNQTCPNCKHHIFTVATWRSNIWERFNRNFLIDWPNGLGLWKFLCKPMIKICNDIANQTDPIFHEEN